MKRLVVVGACYIDTILTVPHYPQEDEKLRAESVQRRRGGNGPNSLEVLQQLLEHDVTVRQDGSGDLAISLVSVLPARDSAATAFVRDSLGSRVDLSACLFREEKQEAASSYIIRSHETGSRTITNYNELDEMTVAEFDTVLTNIPRAGDDDDGNDNHNENNDGEICFHFEGRIPDVTIECIRLIRRALPRATISVEVEKAGRPGLQELANAADVVFYSKSWAAHAGHDTSVSCVREQAALAHGTSLLFCTWGGDGAAVYDRHTNEVHRQPADVHVSSPVDTIGAGDTFIAGVLFAMLQRADWKPEEQLLFANTLAGLKVGREGFGGLGADIQPCLRRISSLQNRV